MIRKGVLGIVVASITFVAGYLLGWSSGYDAGLNLNEAGSLDQYRE